MGRLNFEGLSFKVTALFRCFFSLPTGEGRGEAVRCGGGCEGMGMGLGCEAFGLCFSLHKVTK